MAGQMRGLPHRRPICRVASPQAPGDMRRRSNSPVGRRAADSERDGMDAFYERLIVRAATIDELGIALHREQFSALGALLNGENLILSAPTSFGKSILIDALLLNERYKRVAIVLPTTFPLAMIRFPILHLCVDYCARGRMTFPFLLLAQSQFLRAQASLLSGRQFSASPS